MPFKILQNDVLCNLCYKSITFVIRRQISCTGNLTFLGCIKKKSFHTQQELPIKYYVFEISRFLINVFSLLLLNAGRIKYI